MKAEIDLLELNEDALNNLAKEKNININYNEEFRWKLADNSLYKALGINYGIIYNFDSVQIDSIDEIVLDMDNIIEARLFGENLEIDIRVDEGNIIGNIAIDSGRSEFIKEETFYLRGSKYEKLRVKNYIALDEDNQGYIFYMKPCELLKEA